MKNELERKVLNGIRKAVLATALYSAVNLSSFLGVGGQKLAGISPEQAAFNSYWNYGRRNFPTSWVYGPGAELGHYVFYDQKDFREVAKSAMEK